MNIKKFTIRCNQCFVEVNINKICNYLVFQTNFSYKMNQPIIFSGLSKNCFETVVDNLNFLTEFVNKNPDLNIHILIIDSDSNDGTKEYVMNICNKNEKIKLINIDSLLNKISTRVDRIAYCRNEGLKFINKYYDKKSIIYIPMDLDINLFKHTTREEFSKLINFMTGGNSIFDVMLPCSTPYYYDIFALRASGWVNFNVQKVVYYLKRYLKIGSFIWNYIFIFRYQWSINKVKNKRYKLISAFGGIGIYSINEFDIETYKYPVFKNVTHNFNSEHIEFNKLFTKLKINTDWQIPAPEQHTEYLSAGLKGKIKYILRTMKYDFLNINSND